MKSIIHFLIILLFGISNLYANSSSLTIYRKGNKIVLAYNFPHKIILRSTNDDEIFERAFENLKEANGGKLHISSGRYFLRNSYQITKNVLIEGEGKATKLFFGSEFNGNDAAFKVDKQDGVTISNLSLLAYPGLKAPESGILVSSSGNFVSNNLLVLGFEKYGIILGKGTFLSSITGCEIGDNKVSNILLKKLSRGGRYGDFLPNSIKNNTIFGGGNGIELDNALLVNIIGCSIYQSTGAGIFIHGISNSALLSGNRTFQIIGKALLIENSSEINVTGNIFCWQTEEGIVVKNAEWGTITGNEIIDSGSFNSGLKNDTDIMANLPKDYTPFNGVILDAVIGFNVNNNTIFNWGVCPPLANGIYESEKSQKNIINDNIINYFSGEAVISNGKNSLKSGNVFEAKTPFNELKNNRGNDGTPNIESGRVLQSFETTLFKRYIDSLREQ